MNFDSLLTVEATTPKPTTLKPTTRPTTARPTTEKPAGIMFKSTSFNSCYYKWHLNLSNNYHFDVSFFKIESECEDTYCDFQAAKGKCNKGWMKQRCKKACGLCKKYFMFYIQYSFNDI